MKLSIVTTLYLSAAHLDEFHARAVGAAEKVADEFEINVARLHHPPLYEFTILVRQGCVD